jgi:hypothetical protein
MAQVDHLIETGAKEVIGHGSSKKGGGKLPEN